jgi:adenylate kinase family enzyme
VSIHAGPQKTTEAGLDLSRVIVIGNAGSGKTTFASEIAAILSVQHIELDAIFWLPNWTPRDRDDFRDLVEEALSVEKWVVDGNYSSVRDVVWPRATTAVWLNYPFPLVFWRVFRRTVQRVIHREMLFSGNQESLRKAFLSRESLLWWVIKSHSRRRRQFRATFDAGVYPGLALAEFRKPGQADSFLQTLAAASG